MDSSFSAPKIIRDLIIAVENGDPTQVWSIF